MVLYIEKHIKFCYNHNIMKKTQNRHTKQLAQLYYQDLIWELHKSGKSIRTITEIINKKHLPRSRFKGITLSKDTIHKIIKKLKGN